MKTFCVVALLLVGLGAVSADYCKATGQTYNNASYVCTGECTEVQEFAIQYTAT